MNPKASHISISHGMSGYYAIQLVWCSDHGGFWEPWTTGPGRYEDKAEAVREGQDWAESEGMAFRL